jgi:hypothetical protein
MGLLRYQIFLSQGIVFLALWYAGLQQQDLILEKQQQLFPSVPLNVVSAGITYTPLFAVLLLGLYAAGSIIIGVANFSDCPEAAAEIDVQVKEAKAALLKKGVKF